MKKVTLLCGLLLALTASVSAAAGVNIRWVDCFGAGGVLGRTFACTNNTGADQMTSSFVLPAAGLADVSGTELVIDLGSASLTLPAWWQYKNAFTCRPTALGINTTNPLANEVPGRCPDWSAGQQSAGIAAYLVGGRGPNCARIIIASAVASDALQLLSGGQEYFSCNLTMTHVKTVGTGLCAGCLTSVCIVLNSVNVTTPISANNIKLTGPTNLGLDSDFITWQGGAGVLIGGVTGCGAATPNRSTTWGAVKNMYR